MSEINEAVDSVSEPAQPPVSAGQLLRQARLDAGVHIGALSLALKVSVKKLEALENDDWDQLPDAVFARALATSVCKQVRTDSAPILAALPKSNQLRDIDQGSHIAIPPTFDHPSDSKWLKLSRRLSIPMLLGAVVLLFAALLLIFVPQMLDKPSDKKAQAHEKTEPLAIPKPVLPQPSPSASAPVVPPITASAPLPLPVIKPAASAPVVVPVIKPAASAPVAAPAVTKPAVSAPAVAPAAAKLVAPASASAPAPTSTPVLRLVAKGAVWVQVKDGKGVALVQRSLKPKEVVDASGAPPLSVVIGRVNEIESVTVRGKPFNLGPMSGENIARFEVK